jgi:hypothetical protein
MNAIPSLPTDISGTPVEDEQRKSRAAQQVLHSHSATLMGNGSFQFFRDEIIGRRVQELEAVCCDARKSRDEREGAVNLLDELRKIRDWAETTMETTRAYLASTESSD